MAWDPQSVGTDRGLYPTPARLALLRQVDNGQVMVDPAADGWRVILFPDAPDSYQEQRLVTGRVTELERAGWIREVEPLDFELTETGRQILATYAGPAVVDDG